MSQYNLNGFNRSPYNVKPDYNASWLNATFSETVSGAFGTSSLDFLNVNINERVSFSGNLVPTWYLTATGTESVVIDESVSSVFMTYAIFEETTANQTVTPSIIVKTEAVLSEILSGTSALGSNINLDLLFAEVITADTQLGSHKGLSVEGYELVSSVTNAESVNEYVCNLNVQLEPGSTIIIDANNYNILIDGENAIWTQSGDWLDNLNRETISLNIQAASGGEGLSATVLYTERYL